MNKTVCGNANDVGKNVNDKTTEIDETVIAKINDIDNEIYNLENFLQNEDAETFKNIKEEKEEKTNSLIDTNIEEDIKPKLEDIEFPQFLAHSRAMQT